MEFFKRRGLLFLPVCFLQKPKQVLGCQHSAGYLLADPRSHVPLRFLPCPWKHGLWDRWPRGYTDEYCPALSSHAHLPTLPSSFSEGRDRHPQEKGRTHITHPREPHQGWQVVTWGEQFPASPEGSALRASLGCFSLLCLPSWRRAWMGRALAPGPFSCRASRSPRKVSEPKARWCQPSIPHVS